MKRALITGITGQDGSYLAELLLEKGYEVHGIIRRSSSINTDRIDRIYDSITLYYGDLTDATNLVRVIKQVQPNEIYNLGAQSHVKVSFEMPEYTADVDGWDSLPPDFQFPVKELMASLKDPKESCINSPFVI